VTAAAPNAAAAAVAAAAIAQVGRPTGTQNSLLKPF
jgi:hypothetical protein